MINQKLQDFDEDVKPLGDTMTQATIEIYNFISKRMLPTPTKIHYLFNLRDFARVIQGKAILIPICIATQGALIRGMASFQDVNTFTAGYFLFSIFPCPYF